MSYVFGDKFFMSLYSIMFILYGLIDDPEVKNNIRQSLYFSLFLWILPFVDISENCYLVLIPMLFSMSPVSNLISRGKMGMSLFYQIMLELRSMVALYIAFSIIIILIHTALNGISALLIQVAISIYRILKLCASFIVFRILFAMILNTLNSK